MSDAPHAFLANLRAQLLLARCVAMMAEIGIADLVADAPRSPAELAQACGVNAEALMRILRLLAANGVFRADDSGAICNTATSDLLRDRPGSMRDTLRTAWQDVIWDTYRQLPLALRTGEPAFTAAFGMSFFGYLAAHPDIGSRFDASMALMSAPENAAIARSYPFDRAEVIVDVGGGRGGLTAAILQQHTGPRAILYDQPQVLQDVAALHVAALMDRCTLETGDFFVSVPAGGDIYVLKRILHDWSDAEAVRILRTVRAALKPGARIVVLDAVLKPGNEPDPNKMLDVGIMALTKGRERTAEDFHRLFAAAGLRVTRILAPTPPSPMSLVEGSL